MISPHKTPALAKLAMLLLFAIATVAILDTTSISAQELGKTITSPFGVANPYMNTSDSSESGSDGDIFVDPETGEGGHIIRNPFGQAADPEMDNTDSDTFEVVKLLMVMELCRLKKSVTPPNGARFTKALKSTTMSKHL